MAKQNYHDPKAIYLVQNAQLELLVDCKLARICATAIAMEVVNVCRCTLFVASNLQIFKQLAIFQADARGIELMEGDEIFNLVTDFNEEINREDQILKGDVGQIVNLRRAVLLRIDEHVVDVIIGVVEDVKEIDNLPKVAEILVNRVETKHVD